MRSIALRVTLGLTLAFVSFSTTVLIAGDQDDATPVAAKTKPTVMATVKGFFAKFRKGPGKSSLTKTEERAGTTTVQKSTTPAKVKLIQTTEKATPAIHRPVATQPEVRPAPPAQPRSTTDELLIPPPLEAATRRALARPVVYEADTVRLLDDENCVPAGDCDPSGRGVRQNHRSGLIGEFLYLQARSVDIPYATPTNGLGGNAVPIGATLYADPMFQPGFRVGLTSNLTDESSLSGNYWFYQSQLHRSASLPGGTGYFDPVTMHPNTISVITDNLATSAEFDLDFDVVDAHYRSTVYDGDLYYLDLTVGARYTRIDEDFHASYSVLGTTDVDTALGFDGCGPRLGLELERPFDGRMHLFVRSAMSLLLGHVTGEYTQTNSFGGISTPQATAEIDDSRFVPVTELEVGLGWDSPNGNWRFSGAYYVATYHNTLTTGRFIQGVQNNNLYKLNDSLTFDGLQARIEIHW